MLTNNDCHGTYGDVVNSTTTHRKNIDDYDLNEENAHYFVRRNTSKGSLMEGALSQMYMASRSWSFLELLWWPMILIVFLTFLTVAFAGPQGYNYNAPSGAGPGFGGPGGRPTVGGGRPGAGAGSSGIGVGGFGAGPAATIGNVGAGFGTGAAGLGAGSGAGGFGSASSSGATFGGATSGPGGVRGSGAPGFSAGAGAGAFQGGRPSGPVVPILRDDREGPTAEGFYSFSYESGDGTIRQEQGAPQGPAGAVASQGSWSFTFPDGTPAEFQFVADEGGYRVESPLLPTPPPLPAHAIAQIEKAAQEAASGVQYDESGFPTSGQGAGGFGGFGTASGTGPTGSIGSGFGAGGAGAGAFGTGAGGAGAGSFGPGSGAGGFGSGTGSGGFGSGAGSGTSGTGGFGPGTGSFGAGIGSSTGTGFSSGTGSFGVGASGPGGFGTRPGAGTGTLAAPNRQVEITDLVKKIYKAYFGVKLEDQDKPFAPYICCKTCVENSLDWRKKKRKRLSAIYGYETGASNQDHEVHATAITPYTQLQACSQARADYEGTTTSNSEREGLQRLQVTMNQGVYNDYKQQLKRGSTTTTSNYLKPLSVIRESIEIDKENSNDSLDSGAEWSRPTENKVSYSELNSDVKEIPGITNSPSSNKALLIVEARPHQERDAPDPPLEHSARQTSQEHVAPQHSPELNIVLK
ncbi:uncharacterized protein LOC143040788 [Oratosquilla oratoria]|uniref:uncharacterized protein LOC143040788 n=1 Tax=Oratosquilla oratoria TaxID=337810 RepID=UPI003F76339C